MEKRRYVAPECVVTEMESIGLLCSSPSLGVNNDPMDDFMGDVNSDNGFKDIWGNEF